MSGNSKSKAIPRLLIIPSWYISPDDRVNGSFFQAQGSLVSEAFETRVLSVNCRLLSLRKLLHNPRGFASECWRFVKIRRGKCVLPDETVFKQPELHRFDEKVVTVRGRRGPEAIVSRWVYRAEEMIAAGWRPDLIRAHTVFPAGLVANAIKSKFGIPYVVSEHMPFCLSRFHPAVQPAIKSAFAQADLVLSLSYDKVRQLAMDGIEVEPNIILNMVDESHFMGLAKGYTPRRPLKLATIGAASFYKDHKTLLRSLQILVDEHVPVHLTIIGLKVWGGDKLEETLGLIQAWHLSEHVTVIDAMSRDQIAETLPQFHVFVMTSIQEGFPNSVLEALASGLFVVATRHGGTEDLLTDEMGRVFPVRSHRQIAEALMQIFRGDITFDPKRIRDCVIERCGRQAYTDMIIGYYNSVLAREKP